MTTPSEMLMRSRRADAARAVQRLNLMTPALTIYAREQTGNPAIRVKSGHRSMTDGKTITILPPGILGKPQVHSNCGEREYGISLCNACATNERVYALLNHEIGHILQGSFGYFSKGRLTGIILRFGGTTLSDEEVQRMSRSLNGSSDDKEWNARVAAEEDHLLGHVSLMRNEYLTMLMLIGEDARCDHARLDGDPIETRNWRSSCEQLLFNGVEQADGSVRHYIELPIDHQIGTAFLFKCAGTEIAGFFEDEVLELMSEPEADGFAQKAVYADNTLDTLEVMLELLTWLNDKDYMKSSGEQDAIDAVEELLKALLGHGSDLESGTAVRGGAGGRASEEESEAGEGIRPEDVKAVMKMVEMFDQMPVGIDTPQVYLDDSGPNTRSSYGEYITSKRNFKSNEFNLSHAVSEARLAFSVNARVEHHRNQRSGRISGKMLARRVPFADERLFARRIVPDTRSYHVVIGMDASGSSCGRTLEEEKMAVLAMADVCFRLGVSFEVWAHCTSYSSSQMDAPVFTQVSKAGKQWTPAEREFLRSLNSSGANLDGHTLQFYRKQAEKTRATDRIVMYYTDGAMPATNYDEELGVLKSEIAYCNKNAITLMAVGMGTNSPVNHGFDTAVVNDSSDYKTVVEHLGRRLAQ